MSNFPIFVQNVTGAVRRALLELDRRIRTIGQGYRAYAVQSSALTAGANTFNDIPGCTVTYEADPARRYKTTLHIAYAAATVANGTIYGLIADAANNQLRTCVKDVILGQNCELTVILLETGLSGQITRKGRLVAITCGVSTNNTSEYAPLILVEDIGAV